MPISPKWTNRFEIKPGTWVFQPSLETVNQGKLIKRLVLSKWTPPDFYYHLRKGGHLSALKSHCEHQFFVHLDLKRFFNSISRSRVTRHLKPILGYERAREFAVDSTVKLADGKNEKHSLPFGFVQSPILASLCLDKSKLGSELKRLDLIPNVKVSLYVDDIVLSCATKKDAKEYMDRLIEAIQKSGFSINTDKIQGPSETITAFNVELSNRQLRVCQSRMDHFSSAYQASDNYHELAGLVSYVESVNPSQANEIK